MPQRFMTMTDDGVLAGVPNFDGRIASLFNDFDVPLHLDTRGFRNPADVNPAAPLAFVGDSFCFGWGVRREESFPVLTAERVGVPFYNYCTVGADLLDDLQILRAWKPPGGRAATVLTVTVENDVLAYPGAEDDGATSASVRGISRSAWSRWLMDHSALFDVTATLARQNASIVALVRRLGIVSGVSVVSGGSTEPITASVRMIERIEWAAGDGPFVVLLVPPRPGQVEFVDYDAFVTTLVHAGFDVVDPRAEPGLSVSTLPRDGHWDAAMHAAIAPVLADRLRACRSRPPTPVRPP